MADEGSEVSELLHQLSQGNHNALDRLVPVVYDELRRLAHAALRSERPGHTLNTTALVHETYLELVKVEQIEWRDRAHFFGVAARVMRRVLIDYARTRKRQKRGGGRLPVQLSEARDIQVPPDDLLVVEELLSRLEALSQRQCRVVECRCFAGMSVEETAAALDTSPATVKRDWALARAWLNHELSHRSNDRHGAEDSGEP